MRSRLMIIGAVTAAVLFFVLLFMNLIPGLRVKESAQPQATLTVWGVFDTQGTWNDLLNKYNSYRPNVRASYRELNPQTYEAELLNALAAGKGPDIFMFHNTWLPKHLDKIAPLPELQFPFIKYREIFPQVAEQDFAPNGTVYASPLYLDTLAMFYNKDLFDKAGIALLPKTWSDFQTAVKKLTEVNPNTNVITRSGAAIGGSEKSINRATDLLGLLMLQSGAKMVDSDFGRATFGASLSDKKPGLSSLTFYTQFANPASPYYTWNEDLHYSVDNFTEGGTAILFNYSHQTSVIKSKNPFLNFGIAETPQLAESDQPVAYANYWGLAVSNKSKAQDWAWDFIIYATTNEEAAKTYADATQKSPALKSLIAKNINDPTMSVFAKQALIARSWQQVDNNEVERSFSEMIQAVLSRRLSPEDALRKSEDEITHLMELKARK